MEGHLKSERFHCPIVFQKILQDNMGLKEVTFSVHARNPFEKFTDNNLNYSDPETSFIRGMLKVLQ